LVVIILKEFAVRHSAELWFREVDRPGALVTSPGKLTAVIDLPMPVTTLRGVATPKKRETSGGAQ